jgi:hypothetical protein
MNRDKVSKLRNQSFGNLCGRLVAEGLDRKDAHVLAGHLLHVAAWALFRKSRLSGERLTETEWKKLRQWATFGDFSGVLSNWFEVDKEGLAKLLKCPVCGRLARTGRVKEILVCHPAASCGKLLRQHGRYQLHDGTGAIRLSKWRIARFVAKFLADFDAPNPGFWEVIDAEELGACVAWLGKAENDPQALKQVEDAARKAEGGETTV